VPLFAYQLKSEEGKNCLEIFATFRCNRDRTRYRYTNCRIGSGNFLKKLYVPVPGAVSSRVVDPKLFFSDPDPTFLRVSDPDPT
jgi:hypothetical protein